MSTYRDALARIAAIHWKTEAGLEDERGNLHDATPMCADCGETGATHEAIVHADDCVIGIAAAALAVGEQEAEMLRDTEEEQGADLEWKIGCLCQKVAHLVMDAVFTEKAPDLLRRFVLDVQREEMERAARIVREERGILRSTGACHAAFVVAEERIRNRKDHP